MTLRQQFAAQLREAMGTMTQEKLEQLSGVHQTTISGHLGARSGLTVATLEKYLAVLPLLAGIRERDRNRAAENAKAVA
jgi:hypothetical protein